MKPNSNTLNTNTPAEAPYNAAEGLLDEIDGALKAKEVSKEDIYRVLLEKVYKDEIRTWELMRQVNKESGMGETPKRSLLQLIENVLKNIPAASMESGKEAGRTFSLNDMIECWEASEDHYAYSEHNLILEAPDKEQYFKEKFNIDLPVK